RLGRVALPRVGGQGGGIGAHVADQLAELFADLLPRLTVGVDAVVVARQGRDDRVGEPLAAVDVELRPDPVQHAQHRADVDVVGVLGVRSIDRDVGQFGGAELRIAAPARLVEVLVGGVRVVAVFVPA